MEDIFKGKSIAKTYLSFALPMVLGMVVSIIYNLTDTWFIARTGNTDLVAGVSLCSPLMMIVMAFGNIFGQGGNSLLSRLIGKEDQEGTKRVSSFCFYAAIITGLLLAILLLGFKSIMLTLFGADPDTFAYADDYYSVLALGTPLCLLTYIHMNLIRSEGFAKNSMISTMSGSIVNMILDPIFIFTLGLGAKGAAIATVCGYFTNVAYSFSVVVRKSHYLSVDIKKCRIPMDYIRQIFVIGVSAAITNILSSIAGIIMNQKLVVFGNQYIASYGIAMRINNVVYLVIIGFAFGGAPLYGYLFGKKDKERLDQLIRFARFFMCGLALVMTLLLVIPSAFLVKCFMNDPEIIRLGSQMLIYQSLSMVFAAVILQATVLFQASGLGTGSLILSMSRQGYVFIPVIYLLSYLFGYTGVLATQLVCDAISAGIALLLYLTIYKKKLAAFSAEIA